MTEPSAVSSPLTPPVTPSTKAGLSRLRWWLVFGLATLSLSLLFRTFKTFTLVPDLANGLTTLVALLAVCITMTALVYDGYVKEKAKGKLQRTFGLFEWLVQRGVCVSPVVPAAASPKPEES